MHVRFSTVIGMSVVEAETGYEIGVIENILLNPDSGAIEGFFVRVPRFLHSVTLFLSVMDIQHWGKRVRVRDEESLVPVQEIIRVQSLLEDGRTLLLQMIKTESGELIGTCRDIQFDTKHYKVEWIFPKKFFRWSLPIPVTSIIRVDTDAVIVRDSAALVPETAHNATTVFKTLDPLTNPS